MQSATARGPATAQGGRGQAIPARTEGGRGMMTPREAQAMAESEKLIAEMRSIIGFCVDERRALLDLIDRSSDRDLIVKVAAHLQRARVRLDAALNAVVH